MMKEYVTLGSDSSYEMTEIDIVGVYFHLLLRENEVNFIMISDNHCSIFYITSLQEK